MDRITKGFLDEFSASFGYTGLEESLQFEYFANYCALSCETGNVEIDVQEMSTGNSAQGIDGIAIEVNGSIVDSLDDIRSLISQNKRLDVKFIFVQSKTSERFENGEIGNFLTFVETFFSEKAKAVFSTAEMLSFIEMKEFIYDNSRYMKTSNPRIDMFYVSLGKWTGKDATLDAVISSHTTTMGQSNLFSNIQFIPCDAQKIQSMYRKSQEQISASFLLPKYIIMFSDENGDHGYSGVLPFFRIQKYYLR